MLAVLLFAAFWVVLGFAVFLLGARGGPSHVVGAQGAGRAYRSRRPLVWTFVFFYVAFGVILPVVFLVGNHNNANGQVGGIKLNAAEKRGREIFGERCGLCHTLAAANVMGKVGPNLDLIQPSEQLTLHTIQYGCLPNPPKGSQEACLGQGVMPADVVQGVDAVDVAKFVAKVAGKE